MSTSRRLLTALVLSAMAVSTTGAAERRPRPTTLYLSTGTTDGGCSPQNLTTSPVGSSNCGNRVSPGPVVDTWTSPATDEGYPFTTAAGTDVEGQVTIGPDFAGYEDFAVTITVELNDEVVFEQTTEHRAGVSDQDIVIEFTFPMEESIDVFDGAVTVTLDGGVVINHGFIDGSGGSWLRFAPVLA